jgi:hypothetical protein
MIIRLCGTLVEHNVDLEVGCSALYKASVHPCEPSLHLRSMPLYGLPYGHDARLVFMLLCVYPLWGPLGGDLRVVVIVVVAPENSSLATCRQLHLTLKTHACTSVPSFQLWGGVLSRGMLASHGPTYAWASSSRER